MCSITAHGRQQPTYVDDAMISGSIEIPKNETTSALKSIGANLNYIDCWIKYFQHKYQERLLMYYDAIIELFKEISTMKSKLISQDKKDQLLLTDIGGSWYIKKLRNKLPPPKNRS